ncbi:MAG: hypothetical protein U5N86_01295 [Planctomycetota bacterium]|nr:hypothetical protein [Planctomycetota bacterium]
MEAFLLFLYGLLLFYPCVQYVREGYHPMLSIHTAPFLLIPVAVIPFLSEFMGFATNETSLPTWAGIEHSAVFFWWVGGMLVTLFAVFSTIQFSLAANEKAHADRWQVVESRAKSALSKGDVDSALSYYENALRSFPTDFRGHYKFAKLLLESGYHKRAYDHLMLTIEHCPQQYRSDMEEEAVKILSADPRGITLAEKLRYTLDRKS